MSQKAAHKSGQMSWEKIECVSKKKILLFLTACGDVLTCYSMLFVTRSCCPMHVLSSALKPHSIQKIYY